MWPFKKRAADRPAAAPAPPHEAPAAPPGTQADPPVEPSLAEALRSAANTAAELGSIDIARVIGRAADDAQRSGAVRQPTEAARALDAFGMYYRSNRQFWEAEGAFALALRVREAAFGGDHVEVALSMNQFAALRAERGHHDLAEAAYLSALGILRKQVAEDHEVRVAVTYNMGRLQQRAGRHGEAVYFLEAAVPLMVRRHGDDPNIVTALANLAYSLQMTRRYADADATFAQAVAAGERCFGPNHPQLVPMLLQQAILFQEMNEPARAQAARQRVEAITGRPASQ